MIADHVDAHVDADDHCVEDKHAWPNLEGHVAAIRKRELIAEVSYVYEDYAKNARDCHQPCQHKFIEKSALLAGLVYFGSFLDLLLIELHVEQSE